MTDTFDGTKATISQSMVADDSMDVSLWVPMGPARFNEMVASAEGTLVTVAHVKTENRDRLDLYIEEADNEMTTVSRMTAGAVVVDNEEHLLQNRGKIKGKEIPRSEWGRFGGYGVVKVIQYRNG